MKDISMPYQIVFYDKENNVIFMDFTNLTITTDIMDQSALEVVKLAEHLLPQKVYLLACFQNSKIAPELQDTWGTYTQRSLEYVKGVIRYQASDLVTNVTLRSNTVRYHTQGNNSFIYPSREAALEAIRQLEKK